MHRTRQLEGHGHLEVEEEEEAKDSPGEGMMSLEPCTMSELVKSVDEKLNLGGLADIAAPDNSISGELESAQGLRPCVSSKLHEEVEKELKSEEKAVVDPEKLISGEVYKASDECDLTPEALQELIMERKAERKRKAEEKRQRGLRRIAEMKSKDGIHPVEHLFPEEIWIKIVGDEDLDPEDRYNLCLVHPFFQTLMGDTMIQDILLPMALNYKIPVLRMFHERFSKAINDQIRTLRLMSKGVRDAVDKWIEDDILHSMHNAEPSPTSQPFKLCLRPSVHTYVSDRVSRYTSSTWTGQRLKFFLRSLEINCYLGSGLEPRHERNGGDLLRRVGRFLNDFIKNVTKYLEKVGDQILYLYVGFGKLCHLTSPGESVLKLHRALRNWLLLLPNLKWLRVNFGTDDEEWERELVNLNAKPMPRMYELERVDTVFSPRQYKMPWIAETVLTANLQIKYFSTDACTYDIFLVQSAVLSLSLENVGMFLEEESNEPFLPQISESNWNLKKMVLSNGGTATLNTILPFLENNFPTLEDVSLDMTFYTVQGTEVTFLRLPNLKHFELSFDFHYDHDFAGEFHFFFDLHFLLYCDKLESLTWENEMCPEELQIVRSGLEKNRNKRFISFPGEGGEDLDLSKSKVWDVFPRLRFIKFWIARSNIGKNKYFRPYRS